MYNNLCFETYLIDRHDIVRKFDCYMFYRDTSNHFWGKEIKDYIRVMEDADVVELIEYDEENEKILSLRNKPGFSCADSVIDACKPCEQVVEYFKSLENKKSNISDYNMLDLTNNINKSDIQSQFIECLETYYFDKKYVYFVTDNNEIICVSNRKTYV